MFIIWKNILFVLITTILLTSCGGKSDEEKVDDAIDTANIYLTKGMPTEAIDILLSVGYQNRNATYLAVMASAYALRAGFSEPNFFGNDIANIGASAANILGTFTTFSTSRMISPNDTKYLDLQIAIDTLLYAGGVTTPTTTERAKIFTTAQNGNITFQLLFMVMAQMGKYFYYYGNADPVTGAKGGGAGTANDTSINNNQCLYDGYLNPGGANDQLATPEDLTDPCDIGDPGHLDLKNPSKAIIVKRMCQGVVLFNTFMDLMTKGTLSSLSQVGSIGTLDDIAGEGGLIDIAYGAACTLSGAAEVCQVYSQSKCEEDYLDDGGAPAVSPDPKLIKYFGFILETLFVGADD